MMGRSGKIAGAFFAILIAAQLACTLTSTGDPTWPSTTYPSVNMSDLANLEYAPEPAIYINALFMRGDVSLIVDCSDFLSLRQALLGFSQSLATFNGSIKLQTNDNFLQEIERCETGNELAETNGLSVLDYLASEYGLVIEIH